MSDPLDLDAIEARVNAATGGPWESECDGTVTQHWTRDEPWVTVVNNEVACMAYCYGGSVHPIDSDADAQFIAHARTDVPALIAEVRRLRAAEERLRALHGPELITDFKAEVCIEGDCEHDEGQCPVLSVEMCLACVEALETCDPYALERSESVDSAAYPCPTIRALDGGDDE